MIFILIFVSLYLFIYLLYSTDQFSLYHLTVVYNHLSPYTNYYSEYSFLLGTNLVGFTAGIATAFCNTFWSFALCRFLVGLAFDNCFTMMYILGEYFKLYKLYKIYILLLPKVPSCHEIRRSFWQLVHPWGHPINEWGEGST